MERGKHDTYCSACGQHESIGHSAACIDTLVEAGRILDNQPVPVEGRRIYELCPDEMALVGEGDANHPDPDFPDDNFYTITSQTDPKKVQVMMNHERAKMVDRMTTSQRQLARIKDQKIFDDLVDDVLAAVKIMDEHLPTRSPLIFTDKGSKIGEFRYDQEAKRWTFDGNMDESAKQFAKFMYAHFQSILEGDRDGVLTSEVSDPDQWEDDVLSRDASELEFNSIPPHKLPPFGSSV